MSDLFDEGRPRLTSENSSAFSHVADVYPMPSVGLGLPPESWKLYHGHESCDPVDQELYERYDVKRGLRNADGSGVLVGLTAISDVHGYTKEQGVLVPDEGNLIYRGFPVGDLIQAATDGDRMGYEEVAYLLITGALPTAAELDDFKARIDARRQLPEGYLHIFPRATHSHSVMNVLQRATLLLYAFDPDPDSTTPTHEIDVALSLLGRWPRAAAVAHAAHIAASSGESLYVPPVREGYSMAETVLDVLRGDEGFTRDEARLLDVMLMLHAEHGGGNNSTFTVRVLSSSGTDAYSAYAAAIGSLKGPKHGGANSKVSDMITHIGEQVSRWDSDDELSCYLEKIVRGQAYDNTGLIYGLGHAVYTKSDPRAQLVKSHARRLAEEKGRLAEFELIESIERLGPEVMRDVKGTKKPLCANIDMYTGFVYGLLGIDPGLYTAIFAMARLAGWTAHRMEELYGAGRIIRPAYNSVMEPGRYIPLNQRTS